MNIIKIKLILLPSCTKHTHISKLTANIIIYSSEYNYYKILYH